jgi:hypothetical protein
MAESSESILATIKHKEMAIVAFLISGYITYSGDVTSSTGPSWLTRLALFFLLVPFFAALIFKLFNCEEVTFLRMMGLSFYAILGAPALVFACLATIIVVVGFLFLVIVSLGHHIGWWALLLLPLLPVIYILSIVSGLLTLAAVGAIFEATSILWKRALSRLKQ